MSVTRADFTDSTLIIASGDRDDPPGSAGPEQQDPAYTVGKTRPTLSLVVTDGRDGALIAVKVIARASKSGVAGIRDGALVVRISAPPVDGAANAELVDVIAGALGVPKRAITIASGATSRRKTLQVAGMTAAGVLTKLSV
jgi:uncharacterized protein (TIGR00251 family)